MIVVVWRSARRSTSAYMGRWYRFGVPDGAHCKRQGGFFRKMRKVWVLLAVFLLAASAPGAALAAGVPIDAAHFPDTAFIVFVREHDTNSDDILSPEEIEAAKSMIVKPDLAPKT